MYSYTDVFMSASKSPWQPTSHGVVTLQIDNVWILIFYAFPVTELGGLVTRSTLAALGGPHLAGRHLKPISAVTARPLMPIKATLRHATQLLLPLCFGGSGICDISAKSISAFHFSFIPGRCPAPTTATTLDALGMTQSCHHRDHFWPQG